MLWRIRAYFFPFNVLIIARDQEDCTEKASQDSGHRLGKR